MFAVNAFSKLRLVNLVGFVVALTMATTSVVQVAAVTPVSADTDGYPWSDAYSVDASNYVWGYSTCPANDGGCMTLNSYKVVNGVNTKFGEADPWLYYLRNCTSYVAWKVAQVYDVSVQGWHDATQWDTGAKAAGYTVYDGVGHVPEVGEIAQWEGTLGHVAYVYAVDATTHVASLDEYNSPAGSGAFKTNGTTASSSEGVPDHYIHLGATSITNHRTDDFGIVRPVNGTYYWYVKDGTSPNGSSYVLNGVPNGGYTGDIPVVGDFNGQ